MEAASPHGIMDPENPTWPAPEQKPPPPPPPPPAGNWKSKAGAIGVLGALLLKFLAKVKIFLPVFLKTGGTMFLSIAAYALQWGWTFAFGFVVMIFVHECGHLIAAKKHGLKVGAPVFIPFMGAFIALKEAPRNSWIEFEVAAGGPIAGAMAAAVCHVAYLRGAPSYFGALASVGYMLNLFNMIPIGFLDGGRMVKAISPWLWLPGMALGVWWMFLHPNFLLLLILLLGLPQVIGLFRRSPASPAEGTAMSATDRLQAGVVYFGLVIALAAAMHLVNLRLHPA